MTIKDREILAKIAEDPDIDGAAMKLWCDEKGFTAADLGIAIWAVLRKSLVDGGLSQMNN